MPEQVKTLVDVTLRRLRDPQGAAHSRVLVRAILSHAQRILNTALGSATETVTLTTEAQRQIYPLPASAARMLAVREDGRDLRGVPWSGFVHHDRGWPGRRGHRFLEYATIGRDLLVIHPAKDEASSVDVIAASLTSALLSEDMAVEVPDDNVPAVLALAEAVLSLRGRDIPAATGAVARVVEHVGKHRG